MQYKIITATNFGVGRNKLFFRDEEGVIYQIDKDTISQSLSDRLHWEDEIIVGPTQLFHITYDDGTDITYIYDPNRRKKQNKAIFGQEGLHLEYKSSLFHSADRTVDDPIYGNKPAQWRELAQQLDGFAHAKTRGMLVIGTNDDGTVITGLDDEVKDIKKTEDALRNYFSQVLGTIFTSTLLFEWKHLNSKLILCITVPEWKKDVIPVGGTEFFLRIGSSCHRLRGQDLIDFIRNYQLNA